MNLLLEKLIRQVLAALVGDGAEVEVVAKVRVRITKGATPTAEGRLTLTEERPHEKRPGPQD